MVAERKKAVQNSAGGKFLALWWHKTLHSERWSPGERAKISLSFCFNVSVWCQQITCLRDSMTPNKDFIKSVGGRLNWKALCVDKYLVSGKECCLEVSAPQPWHKVGWLGVCVCVCNGCNGLALLAKSYIRKFLESRSKILTNGQVITNVQNKTEL